jgi:hypothetical protein
MDAKLGIDDCHRVGPHLAGADRVVGGFCRLFHPVEDFVIGGLIGARRDFAHLGLCTLSDEKTAALIKGLRDIIERDRYPLSPRGSLALRAILAKLRTEPIREPLPPLKAYAPPREKAGRR